MKPLSEIEALFENKSYYIRGEFINDYDFRDNHFEYYRKFILNAKKISDHLYLSDLIDLSGWLGIEDKVLQVRWFSYLFQSKHYVVKLAVLDYFNRFEKNTLGNAYEKKLKSLLKNRLLHLVKAQVLYNLICLNTKKAIYYVGELNALLSRSNDWRIYLRILNNLKDVEINSDYKRDICQQLTIIDNDGKLTLDARVLLKELKNN